MNLCFTAGPVPYKSDKAVAGYWLVRSPRAEFLASACFLGLIGTIVDDKDITPCTMLEPSANRPPGNRAEEHKGWSEEVIHSIVD